MSERIEICLVVNINLFFYVILIVFANQGIVRSINHSFGFMTKNLNSDQSDPLSVDLYIFVIAFTSGEILTGTKLTRIVGLFSPVVIFYRYKVFPVF